MASVFLKHVYKMYGNFCAVADFDLEVQDGEFVALTGPAGCGKSSVLKMIGGLENATKGELFIDGKKVNDVGPEERDSAMVFQDFTLYPNLTVYENLAFGLKLRKVDAKEIDVRVKAAAAELELTPILDFKPQTLSLAQKRKVALARALVRRPKVFLLDEPLAGLDLKSKMQLKTEIAKLHHRLNTAFIYATSDPAEAMTLADKIVVMKDGKLKQADSPQSVYDNPENLFTAAFFGSLQMNFFKARLVQEDNNLFAVLPGGDSILVPKSKLKRMVSGDYADKEIILGIRGEDLHNEQLFIQASPSTVITAEVDLIEKLGNETILYLKVDGKEEYVTARVDARTLVSVGEKISLAADANRLQLFDPETEASLTAVPSLNMIEAKLNAENGALKARFGNCWFTFSEETAQRLHDHACINGDVYLGITPENLSLQPWENSSVIDGDVYFTETYQNYTAAYVSVPGKHGFVVAKLPQKSTVSGGDRIRLFVDPAKIGLFDFKTKDSLLLSRPVPSNTAKATVSVKDGVVFVSVGGKKVSFTAAKEMGEAENYTHFHIAAEGISFDKEDLTKNPKCVLSGAVCAIESLGRETVVYLTVEGFEPYLCARVFGTVEFALGEKVKFSFDPQKTDFEKPLTLKEVLAQKSAQTPPYVFVEKKE